MTGPRFITELILVHDLLASHSLDTREELHEHLWRIELRFTGTPVRGRIVDFPKLEAAVEAAFLPYSRANLNQHPRLNEAARAFPTCETPRRKFFSRVGRGAVAGASHERKQSVDSPALDPGDAGRRGWKGLRLGDYAASGLGVSNRGT